MATQTECLCKTKMQYLSGIKTRLWRCPKCHRVAIVTEDHMIFYSEEKIFNRLQG